MHVSSVTMLPYLRGVEYPLAKELIIEVAKDNGASSELVKTLDEMPSGKYFGLLDVVQEIQDVGMIDAPPMPVRQRRVFWGSYSRI